MYVPTEAGKSEKRTVKIGKKSEHKTEILEGLHEGERDPHVETREEVAV